MMQQKTNSTCFVLMFNNFFHDKCTSTNRSLFIFDWQIWQDAGPELHEGQPHFVFHIIRIHFGMDVHVLVTCTGKLRPRNRNLRLTIVGVARG